MRSKANSLRQKNVGAPVQHLQAPLELPPCRFEVNDPKKEAQNHNALKRKGKNEY